MLTRTMFNWTTIIELLLAGCTLAATAFYLLEHLRAATSEIYFHPAVYPADRPLAAHEQQCQIEFETLISPRVRERVAQTGIQLTNYIEMEAQG